MAEPIRVTLKKGGGVEKTPPPAPKPEPIRITITKDGARPTKGDKVITSSGKEIIRETITNTPSTKIYRDIDAQTGDIVTEREFQTSSKGSTTLNVYSYNNQNTAQKSKDNQIMSPAPDNLELMSPAPTIQSRFQEQVVKPAEQLSNLQKAKLNTSAFVLSKADDVIQKVVPSLKQPDTFESKRFMFENNVLLDTIDKGVQEKSDSITRFKKGESGVLESGAVLINAIFNPLDFASSGKVSAIGGEVVKNVLKDPAKAGATALIGGVAGGAVKVAGNILKPAVSSIGGASPLASASLSGIVKGLKAGAVVTGGLMAGQNIAGADDKIKATADVISTGVAFGVGFKVGQGLASGVSSESFANVGKGVAKVGETTQASLTALGKKGAVFRGGKRVSPQSKVQIQKQSRNQQFDPRKTFDTQKNQIIERSFPQTVKDLGGKSVVKKLSVDSQNRPVLDVSVVPKRSDVFRGPDKTIPTRKAFRDPQGGSQSLTDVRQSARNIKDVGSVSSQNQKVLVVQQTTTKQITGIKLSPPKRQPLPSPQTQVSDNRLVLESKPKQGQIINVDTKQPNIITQPQTTAPKGRERVRQEILTRLRAKQAELAKVETKTDVKMQTQVFAPKKSDLVSAVPKSEFEGKVIPAVQNQFTPQVKKAKLGDSSFSIVGVGLSQGSKSSVSLTPDISQSSKTGVTYVYDQRFIQAQGQDQSVKPIEIQSVAQDQFQIVEPVSSSVSRSPRPLPASGGGSQRNSSFVPPLPPPTSISPPSPPPSIRTPPFRPRPQVQPPRTPFIPVTPMKFSKETRQMSNQPKFELLLKPSAKQSFTGTGITSTSLRDIVSKGAFKVGETAKASFAVKDEKGKIIDAEELIRFAPSSKFTLSKSFKGALVQKPSTRISSRGEVAEITLKGIQSQKNRRK